MALRGIALYLQYACRRIGPSAGLQARMILPWGTLAQQVLRPLIALQLLRACATGTGALMRFNIRVASLLHRQSL